MDLTPPQVCKVSETGQKKRQAAGLGHRCSGAKSYRGIRIETEDKEVELPHPFHAGKDGDVSARECPNCGILSEAGGRARREDWR